jgi:hypothetical protein
MIDILTPIIIICCCILGGAIMIGITYTGMKIIGEY